ncbi:unnamed protein product [Adineta steineri]|uniref:Peptidase C1A papain C-terminal domain-containing protein n=1 Tax=Adineta steineri TaxID=433720 RepID=A0A815QK81_9BILA|nr:unnamed protein product [Adineta steineri]CAF4167373.1 unnamed protein product [Adineta steineri]
MRSYQQTHPDATFTMAINHLTDHHIEDLVFGPKTHFKSRPTLLKSSIDVKNLPESLDWRTKGVITPVHSEVGVIITAIVSTELVETLYAIETDNLIQGSISQVFDCCPQPIDQFDCIMNFSGICRNSDYPESLDTCKPDKCKPFATFNKINRLTKADENTMLAWIQDSTLWAETDAVIQSFASYSGGIYDDSSCSQTDMNHVMQIVGYGIEGDTPYWLCKNNWGEKWGEKGYVRIVRGKNMCGIGNVVIQIANTKKSDAIRQYSIVPMSLIVLLMTISQRFINYS